jgi:hypothetical protein
LAVAGEEEGRSDMATEWLRWNAKSKVRGDGCSSRLRRGLSNTQVFDDGSKDIDSESFLDGMVICLKPNRQQTEDGSEANGGNAQCQSYLHQRRSNPDS